jgi:hypothetical protein
MSDKIKKCGYKESCFEKGTCWGHLEGVMCKHLGEDTCLKTKEEIKLYTSEKEFKELTNENLPD